MIISGLCFILGKSKFLIKNICINYKNKIIIIILNLNTYVDVYTVTLNV